MTKYQTKGNFINNFYNIILNQSQQLIQPVDSFTIKFRNN